MKNGEKKESRIYLMAKEFVESFGDAGQIAQRFHVKKGAVELWFKRKSFPQSVFEAMDEAQFAGRDAAPERIPTTEPAPEFEPMVRGEDAQGLPEHVSGDPVEAKLLDLHLRQKETDDKLDQVIALLQRGAGNATARVLPPSSGVRPPGRSAQNALAAAGIKNPGLPGIGSGRAPTREEAHNSNGPRNIKAGPAAPRKKSKHGNPHWNTPPPRPQLMQFFPVTRQ